MDVHGDQEGDLVRIIFDLEGNKELVDLKVNLALKTFQPHRIVLYSNNPENYQNYNIKIRLRSPSLLEDISYIISLKNQD